MNTKPVLILLSLIFVPLLFGYLYQLGDIVEKSYQLNSQQEKLEQLQETKTVLEGQVAKMISLAEVEGRISSSSFVPVEKVKYLTIEPRTLAQGNKELTLR